MVPLFPELRFRDCAPLLKLAKFICFLPENKISQIFLFDIAPGEHSWLGYQSRASPAFYFWSTAGDWTTRESDHPISKSSLSSCGRGDVVIGHESPRDTPLLNDKHQKNRVNNIYKSHSPDSGRFNIPSCLAASQIKLINVGVHSDTVKLKNEGDRGSVQGSSLFSDDIYKGPGSLLLLLDMKVKTEGDNGSDSLLEY